MLEDLLEKSAGICTAESASTGLLMTGSVPDQDQWDYAAQVGGYYRYDRCALPRLP